MWLALLISFSEPTRSLNRKERRALVQATRLPWRRRVLAALACVGVGALLGLVVAWWLAMRVHWRLWDYAGDVESIWQDLLSDDAREYLVAGTGGLMVFAAAACGAAVLAAKYRFVRLLRDRGACAQCGHGLSGLPLDDEAGVTCPECRARMVAIASWKERGTDAAGRAVFVPATGLVRFPVDMRVVARGAKWVGAAAAIMAIVYGAWWGVREVRIRREARVAMVDHAARANELKQAMGAKTREEVVAPGLWEEMARLSADVEKSVAAATAKAQAANPGVEVGILMSSIWSVEADSGEEGEKWARYRQAATTWFAQARGEAWYSAMDAFPDLDAAPVWTQGWAEGSLDLPFSGMRSLRDVQFARLYAARPGDGDDFAGAVAVTLAMARGWEGHGVAIASLTGSATRAMFAKQVLDARKWNWSAEELARVQAVYDAAPVGEAASIVRAEGAWSRAQIALHFSDVARVRRGVHDETFTGSDATLARALLLNSDSSLENKRLGTYAENVAALERTLGEIERFAAMSPAERVLAMPGEMTSDHELVMIASLWDPLMFALENRDAAEALQTMVVTALALERYRVEKGAYPMTLDALVPAYVSELPIDAMDRQPLRYRFADGSYTMWSIGLNCVDDGGVWNTQYGPLSAVDAAKHDIVVTSPECAR